MSTPHNRSTSLLLALGGTTGLLLALGALVLMSPRARTASATVVTPESDERDDGLTRSRRDVASSPALQRDDLLL